MTKLICFITLILILSNCKKDTIITPCDDVNNPNCPNYNPCNGKEPIVSNFNVYNYRFSVFSGLYTKYSDTVVFYNGKFIVNLQNANCTWIFDNKDTLQGAIVSFGTASVAIGGHYISDSTMHKVKLIVKATPNLNCFPNDDGIDSITKYIQFKNYKDAYICGTYKGALTSNPTDSFIVTIRYDYQLIPTQYYDFVQNLNNDGGTFNDAARTWDIYDRELIMKYKGDSQLGIMGIRAKVNPITKLITIDFDMENPNNSGEIIEVRHFTGKKIN